MLPLVSTESNLPDMKKKYRYNKQVSAIPAYDRRPVTWEDALSWFTRGWNYLNMHDYSRLGIRSFFSIRDCAPGCRVRIHYGKRLQKSGTYVVPTQEGQVLARLQTIDKPNPFPSEADVRRELAGYRPSMSQIVSWVTMGQLSSCIAEQIIEYR